MSLLFMGAQFGLVATGDSFASLFPRTNPDTGNRTDIHFARW